MALAFNAKTNPPVPISNFLTMTEIVRGRFEKGNGHCSQGLSTHKRVLRLLFDFSDHLFDTAIHSAPVAQLDRVPASEAVGCGFDPRRVQFPPNRVAS